jgi:CheY-like chemotaxis protein
MPKTKPGKKKILIVEDEYVGALSLADLLGSWGYGVCEIAGTGEEAVQITKREGPDIILMDVSLHGGMSGIEAAKTISCQFHVPVLFMSGYSEDVIKKRVDLCGTFQFLEKPINFEELEEKLKSMLAHPNKTC